MIHLVNVDPLNPAGRPTAQQIRAVGFDGVRLVPRPENEQVQDYCLDIWTQGLSLVYCLAQEALGTDDDQIKRLAWYVGHLPRPLAWQIGNEPDGGYLPGHPDGNDPQTRWERAQSSWTMEPADWWDLHQLCAAYLRGQGHQISTASFVSGHPSWARDAGLSSVDCDQIACHPYAKSAAEAEALLVEYQALRARPIVVPEWNRPAEEINGFAWMLDRSVRWAAWFCWSAGMVENFGLVDRDGRPKPEYHAMQAVLGEDAPADVPSTQSETPTYKLGFLEFAKRYSDLLGAPLQGERYPHDYQSVQVSQNGLLIWTREYGIQFAQFGTGRLWDFDIDTLVATEIA